MKVQKQCFILPDCNVLSIAGLFTPCLHSKDSSAYVVRPDSSEELRTLDGEARGPRETTSAHGLECVLHCPLGPLSHTDNTYKKKCSTSVNMFCLLVDLGEQSERSAAGSC